jgi:hypothetical protein
MSLEELKTFSPVFEKDIYDAISMETCVNKRLTIGAPGEEAMKQVISVEEAYLASNEGNYLGQIYAEPHKSYENVMYAGASPISEADS